jgi:hypothetical protein
MYSIVESPEAKASGFEDFQLFNTGFFPSALFFTLFAKIVGYFHYFCPILHDF